MLLQKLSAVNLTSTKEYAREVVQVHPLAPLKLLSASETQDNTIVPSNPPPIPQTDELSPAVEAQTYVFLNVRDLERDLWSYEDFIRHNAWKWVGLDAEDNSDYAEVDRRRDMEGQIVREPTLEGAV